MSIWDGVDRLAFERNLTTLSKKEKYQNVSSLTDRLTPCTPFLEGNDSQALDTNTESQLVNDFAFLACTTTWPRDVTAATMRQTSDLGRISVSIAAN